jgi:hypothetical protein
VISRISAWINSVNTTSLRIIASIGGAIFCTSNVLLAMLWKNWTPNPMQYKVLIGIAGVLLTMQGFDVIQFASKRFSDKDYAAAKNPTQPVKVDTPPVREEAASAADGPTVKSAWDAASPTPSITVKPTPEREPDKLAGE